MRIGVTIMDRNKPTDLMSQKGWIRLLYRITSQHSEPLGEIGKREGSGDDLNYFGVRE